MSSGIEKLRNEFATIYDGLNGEYQGYIQMSDKRIEHVYVNASKLPDLDTLYVNTNNEVSDVNYVLEMALFDPDTQDSVLVRQHNDGWLNMKKNLKDISLDDKDSYFSAKEDEPKMKIAQIWEEVSNEFCEGWDVLEPKYLMFAGFEGQS